MREFIEEHLIAVIAGAVAVIVLVVGGVLLAGGSTSSSGPIAPKGFTYKPTVTTLPANVAHPATPKPAVAPPKIYATGACGQAMDTLRTLFVKYPSGLSIDATGATALTADLKTLTTACTPTQAQAFRVQELTPWLDYAVPK